MEETERAAPAAVDPGGADPAAILPVRFALTPIMALVVGVTGAATGLFWILFALRLLSQAVTVLAGRDVVPRRVPAALVPLDLMVLAALVGTSGGAQSPLRVLLAVLPLAVAVVSDRGATVRTGVLIGLCYAVPAAPDVLEGEDGALTVAALQLAGMVFATAVGVALVDQRRRLTERATGLEAERRRLLADVLAEEDAERRRTSQVLHAEALQALLAARQDVQEAADGDDAAFARARSATAGAIALLRATIRDLSPTPPQEAGLEQALKQTVARLLPGPVTVQVDDGAVTGRAEFVAEFVRASCAALARAGADGPVDVSVVAAGGGPMLTVATAFDEAALAPWAARAQEIAHGSGGRVTVGPGQIVAQLSAFEPDAQPSSTASDAELERSARRIRVLALAVLLPYVAAGDEIDPLFAAVGAGWLLSVAVAAVLTRRDPAAPRFVGPRVAATVLLSYASLATTGGADSALDPALLLVPFVGVFVLGARATALVSAALVLAHVAASLPGIVGGVDDAVADTLATAAALAWSGAVAALLAGRQQALTERTAGLHAARRRLLHDAAGAARRERRRLALRLQDEPLQAVLAASQDLDEAAGGEDAACSHAEASLADALARLRAVVDDLHPPALEHGGLPAALAALGREAATRAGFRIAVEVDRDAGGERDELIVSMVRELLRNAALHAGATLVRISVRRLGDGLSMELADDGRGVVPDASEGGDTGLASCRERAAAAGGRLEVFGGAGEGTRVVVQLPSVHGELAGAAA